MKTTFWLSALVVCSAFSLIAGVLFAEDAQDLYHQALRYAGLEPVQSDNTPPAAKQNAALEKEFEDILNGFLKTFNQQVKTYKNQRKVVDELLTPNNLRAPEYVSQNYALMNSLLPELRAQSGEVMVTFTAADQQIKDALEGQAVDTRHPIEQKWREVKTKSVERALKFMETDAEILRLSSELLAFYEQNKNQMGYDEMADELYFDSESLILQEDRYLRDIEDLKDIRRAILSGNI